MRILSCIALLTGLSACNLSLGGSGGTTGGATDLPPFRCDKGASGKACLSLLAPVELEHPTQKALLAGGAEVFARVHVTGSARGPIRIESGTPGALGVVVTELTMDSGRWVAQLRLTTAAAGLAEIVVRDGATVLDHWTMPVVAPTSIDLAVPAPSGPWLVAQGQPILARFLPRAGQQILVGALPTAPVITAEPAGAITFVALPPPSPNLVNTEESILGYMVHETEGASGVITRFSVALGDAALHVSHAGLTSTVRLRGVDPQSVDALRFSRTVVAEQLTRSCTGTTCTLDEDREDFDVTGLIAGVAVYGVGCTFETTESSLVFTLGTGLSLFQDLEKLKDPSYGAEPIRFLGSKAVTRHSVASTKPGVFTATCRIGSVTGAVTIQVNAPAAR